MGSKMKVLVTGGGGFVGKALISALVKKNWEISSLSRSHYPELKNLGIDSIQGDICDKDKIIHACKGKEVVFHVAAKVGLWGKYSDFYKTNVEGTKNIIEACLINKVKYLIFTSSASVVFGGNDIKGGNESLPYPLKPESHYTATKALAEKLILQANCTSLKTISLRPHVVWGPGDNHIIPGILKRAKSGRLWQIGNNNHRVDTTYIDNFTDAQLNALDTLINKQIAEGKAYFITNAEPIKVWDFINGLLDVFDFPPIEKKLSKKTALSIAGIIEGFNKIFTPQKEPFLTRFAVNEVSTSHWFDITNAKKDLSYKPRISIEEGLKRIKKESKENK